MGELRHHVDLWKMILKMVRTREGGFGMGVVGCEHPEIYETIQGCLRVWHMILPHHLGKCSKIIPRLNGFRDMFWIPATRSIWNCSYLGKGW